VPKKGLEPPHPCEYMDLNHARLPIPPLRPGMLVPLDVRLGRTREQRLMGCINILAASLIFCQRARVGSAGWAEHQKKNRGPDYLKRPGPDTRNLLLVTRTTQPSISASNNSRGDFIPRTWKVKMSAQTQMEPTTKIPSDISTELRRLAHDLSNSLETIMQASYLLSQSKLDETSQRWAGLIDNATRDAARINREVREILRSRST
jgi:hypothetical protein